MEEDICFGALGKVFPNLHMGIGDRHGDMSDLFISRCESVLIGLRERHIHISLVYDQLPIITDPVSGLATRLRGAKSELPDSVISSINRQDETKCGVVRAS